MAAFSCFFEAHPFLANESDFVLGDGEVAVEVKGSSRVDPSDFRSPPAFIEDNHPRHAIFVCNAPVQAGYSCPRT